MLSELGLHFVAGGILVSVFAVIGDILQPKSFAGIFGAAPSVALASLVLTFTKHSGSYVAVEGQSMLWGAFALGLYCVLVSWLLKRYKWSALGAGTISLLLWLIVAFGLKTIFSI